MTEYYFLSSEDTDPDRIQRERNKARLLRKTQWWFNRVAQGICHYCQGKVSPQELTMDHVVPLARGGVSSKGNLVPSCFQCNQKKKLGIPAEDLIRQLC